MAEKNEEKVGVDAALLSLPRSETLPLVTVVPVRDEMKTGSPKISLDRASSAW